MTEPRQDPDRHGSVPADDLSIVPGFANGALGDGRTRPLDPSRDPDRFDPDAVPELPRGLDPTYDPDRFTPPGQGQSLPDLLGKEATYEGDRDAWQWVYGLLTVLAFLAVVSLLFNYVLTP